MIFALYAIMLLKTIFMLFGTPLWLKMFGYECLPFLLYDFFELN